MATAQDGLDAGDGYCSAGDGDGFGVGKKMTASAMAVASALEKRGWDW